LNKKDRALVLSFSPITTDPRVLRQIRWLSESAESNFELSVFGLQSFPNFPYGNYTQLQLRGLAERLISYTFFSSRIRQKIALRTFLESNELDGLASGHFSCVILNDLDFVGLDELFQACAKSKTPVYVDLHEYFFDFGGSAIYRLLHTRYYRWLLKKLQSRVLSGIFTVSEDISDLYAKKLSIRPVAIMNVPETSKIQGIGQSKKLAEKIQLLYHGAAGKGRGILRVIRAMKEVRQEFELNLILVGSTLQVGIYKLFALVLGLRDRVIFHEPVDFKSISQVLSQFDVQVIFYHPPHSTNERFSLPNKFFESASAGQAIIVGNSPSMRTLVEEFDAGWVVNGWSYSNLAETINSLTREDLLRKKQNALNLSMKLTAQNQGDKFLRALGFPK
jgi:glycosyltransferase involved in cell wall biosynthesis